MAAFQKKYKDDILMPWGIYEPSGTVFYTTQKKINEIYCQGISEFPLSSLQSRQILAYKNGTWESPQQDIWSAIELPPIAQFNFFPPLMVPEFNVPAPATTPVLGESFGESFISLLRDIFGQIAYGFMVERAQAATK